MSVVERITEKAARLPPAQQAKVLEIIDILQKQVDDEDRAWGEVGMKLMAETLDPNEDWSSLEKKRGG